MKMWFAYIKKEDGNSPVVVVDQADVKVSPRRFTVTRRNRKERFQNVMNATGYRKVVPRPSDTSQCLFHKTKEAALKALLSRQRADLQRKREATQASNNAVKLVKGLISGQS